MDSRGLDMPALGLGLGLGFLKAGGAGSVSAFTPVYTEYDGNDYSKIVSQSLAPAAGKLGTLSCMIHLKEDGVTDRIFNAQGTAVFISRQSNDKIRINVKNAASATILEVESTANLVNADGKMHLLCAWNTNAGGNAVIKLGGVDVTGVISPDLDDTVNYTRTNTGIMAAENGAGPATGCISELYFNVAAYITDATKFADGNNPISLGADGSLPTGSQPAWYFPNLLNGVNKGSVVHTLTQFGDPQAGCS